MVRSSRRAVNQEKYRNSVKLNQKLEGDGCPITWWVAIDETLSLNRAVTGIAVSCNGSSVFTTSQGMFSCPKSGLPRIGKCPSSWTWSRAVLRVPSPHRIHFEQWVCDVLLQFCVVCHEKIPFCCWECFPEFKGWDSRSSLSIYLLAGSLSHLKGVFALRCTPSHAPITQKPSSCCQSYSAGECVSTWKCRFAVKLCHSVYIQAVSCRI